MCYSATSSLSSFLIGMPASIYLMMQKNKYIKHIGLFFCSVVLMQLAEFFMWIDQNCGILNFIATKSVISILMLQLFTLIFGGYIYKTIPLKKQLYEPLLVICASYFIYFSALSILHKTSCSKFINGTLQWGQYKQFMLNSYTEWFYFFIFFIFFAYLSLQSRMWALAFIIGNIFLYSNYNVNILSQYSKWCYYSASIPIIIVLIILLKK